MRPGKKFWLANATKVPTVSEARKFQPATLFKLSWTKEIGRESADSVIEIFIIEILKTVGSDEVAQSTYSVVVASNLFLLFICFLRLCDLILDHILC